MTPEMMKARTKRFALQVVALVEALPKTATAKVLGNQLLRSGTSVGANYRAACRGRSTREFIAKMSIVLEEADETIYWLDLIRESQLEARSSELVSLAKEASELVAISVSSIRTARSRTEGPTIRS